MKRRAAEHPATNEGPKKIIKKSKVNTDVPQPDFDNSLDEREGIFEDEESTEDNEVGKEFSGQVGKEVSDGTRSFISPVPSILNEFDALRAEMAAHFEPKVQLAYDLIHVYDPSQEENNPPLRDKNGVMYVPQFPDRHPIVAATISGPATEKVEAIREAIKGNKAWINPQSGKISMQFVRGRIFALIVFVFGNNLTTKRVCS